MTTLTTPALTSNWLDLALHDLRYLGYHVVEGVLDNATLAETRDALYRVRDAIEAEIGVERLTRAGELGVMRGMMKYDRFFTRFLEIPALLEVVDAFLAPTAVLHLQNGFILPSAPTAEDTPSVFQNRFHRDFPRHLDGYVASLNALFCIGDFTPTTGGTVIVPGTHQQTDRPSDDYIAANTLDVECPAGSMILFDSTLWHAAGRNTSGADRLAINHQFTRSFLKQQLDYVRLLGDAEIERLPARSQQLLGWYTRIPTSLDEYYQPPERRLYRGGQG